MIFPGEPSTIFPQLMIIDDNDKYGKRYFLITETGDIDKILFNIAKERLEYNWYDSKNGKEKDLLYDERSPFSYLFSYLSDAEKSPTIY